MDITNISASTNYSDSITNIPPSYINEPWTAFRLNGLGTLHQTKANNWFKEVTTGRDYNREHNLYVYKQARDELIAAAKYFHHSLSLEPNDSQVNYTLAKICLTLEHLGTNEGILPKLEIKQYKNFAVLYFKKATEIEPQNEKYLFWLGYAYYNNFDDQLAMLYLKKVLEINPQNKRAKRYLDRIDYEKKEIAEWLLNHPEDIKKINPLK